MPRVLITCPATNQPVSTGISLSLASFQARPLEDNQFRCPACSQIHTWDKADAYFAADDGCAAFAGDMRGRSYVLRARSEADAEMWEAAWAEGLAMTLEQAITYALEETPEE